MAKEHPLFLLGFCALGIVLFAGGYAARGRADAVARVTRNDDLVGLVASRTPQASAIPLSDFYAGVTDLLKREYVEPIKDDQKLATGAVRGMVLSLGDPRCAFMDADEYRAFLGAREGRYEGIGADFDLRGSVTGPKKPRDPDEPQPLDAEEAAMAGHVPYLVATMVVPGGPADRAGVRPGDVVADVNGHWVVNDAEVARFNQARRDFAAHRIPFATISKVQRALKAKVERALLPAKAKDKLYVGTTDTVDVVWTRNGVSRSTKIAKGVSHVPAFGVQNGALAMRFDAQTAARLRDFLRGKTTATMDLRNNVDGDFDSMRKTLAVVAPNGTYGAVATLRKDPPTPLTVTNGNAHPPRLTIRVDLTTRGPAAIFARALQSRHLATLVGGPTGSDLAVRQVQSLPDGTGYTLVIGEYRPGDANGRVALNEERL